MISHLGTRVSALLDGQLSPEETERAWAHVHSCHLCRDAVEREGWVKTRLAGLSGGPAAAPDRLKGSLLAPHPFPTAPTGDGVRRATVLALGGTALGVAVVGVLALGVGPADPPDPGRRAPVTNLGVSDSPQPRQQPEPVPGPVLRPVSTRTSR